MVSGLQPDTFTENSGLKLRAFSFLKVTTKTLNRFSIKVATSIASVCAEDILYCIELYCKGTE